MMLDCWVGQRWRLTKVDKQQELNMIKRRLLIIILILATQTNLYAIPAAPDPIDIQQPDGSIIRARIQGDELQNWTESEETRHTILHNKSSGYWEYAEQAKDGTLRPNGIRVLPGGLNAPSGVPKVRPLRNRDNERHMQHRINSMQQQAVSSSSSSLLAASDSGYSAAVIWNPTPVSGSKKLLIILVSFADRAIQTTPANWYGSVFDESVKSVAKFYKDNSFGIMRVIPISHSQSGNPAGVVSVTLPSNHPNTGGDFTEGSDRAWGNSALALAASYVNFNSLDSNGDGKIDTSEAVVYFVVAGYDASGSIKTPSVWAHAWSGSGSWIGLTAGSKNIQHWGQNGELNDSSVQHPMGVVAHELGHQMCGLPDLYDISSFNAGLGNFSIMAGGSWGRDYNESYGGTTPTSLDAWSRELLGWSTPIVSNVSSPVSPFSFGYQLSSTSSPYKLILPLISTSEYFLLENRWPTGWDTGLRGMPNFGSGWLGGLLVLHIDNNAGSSINDYTNNVGNRQGVVPVQASTATCNMLASGTSLSCRGNSKTLFYSGNNTTWTPASSPNSNYYSGALTNFYLTAISSPGNTMTAEFSYGPPTVPGAPNMGLAIRSNGQASVSFSAPANDGGSVITGYTVTSSPGGITASAAFSPITAPGLTNGTAYTFTVKATNINGTGLASSISNSVTPATVPGIPSVSPAKIGNGQAFVNFSAPASNGGSAISNFTATSSPGGFIGMGTASPITVNGLANGTSYTFTVAATNSVGTGASSASSGIVTPGVVHNSGFNSMGYLTLQNAYNADTHTPEIQIVAGALAGPFVKTDTDTIIVKGGFDDAFSASNGLPAILGKVELRNGTTRFQNVVIR